MKAEFKTQDLVKQLTLQVSLTGLRQFKLRLAIGLFLFRLASWVVGFGKVEIVRAE